MGFNSSHFLFFLPVSILSFYLFIKHDRYREIIIIAWSYYFYCSWDWKYGALLLISTCLNYGIGWKLGSTTGLRIRKLWLVLSLIFNVGLLCVFKYFNFFTSSLGFSLSLFGVNLSLPHLSVILTVGISFYTFEILTYIIDVYRRQIPVERDLLKFALFVSFFPKLIAGPITRASLFLPQANRKPIITEKRCLEGFFLIYKGLFKKIIIADLLASFALDTVFMRPHDFSSIDLLFALYGYAFQIYNDFSGYTDIAIGIGLLLGFELPQNFNSPYLAVDIRDFWRRWHITLSSWFKDYVYIPLGGNRTSNIKVVLNLAITMLLCGLWHGAKVNFIIWGGYHGFLLVLNRIFQRKMECINLIIRRIICFHLIVLGWLIFRVSSFANFTEYLKGVLALTRGFNLPLSYIVILCLAIFMHYFPKTLLSKIENKYIELPVIFQAGIYAVLIVVFCGFTLEAPSFIYFQF